MGDKSIEFEKQIKRVYPQKNLFSHIVGQIDEDNNGVSGIEKYFDYELKKRNDPLKLTVDSNIQFLIREELMKAKDIFNRGAEAAKAVITVLKNGSKKI